MTRQHDAQPHDVRHGIMWYFGHARAPMDG
jgi:hypothetical protein